MIAERTGNRTAKINTCFMKHFLLASLLLAFAWQYNHASESATTANKLFLQPAFSTNSSLLLAAPAPAPVELAEAFKQMREDDKAAREADTGDGEATEQPAGTSPATPATIVSDSPAGDADRPAPVVQNNNQLDTSDTSARDRQVSEYLRREAAKQTNELMEQNGIKLKWSATDLLVTDEATGVQEYINPDTGTAFQSRSEAVQWAKDQNELVKDKFNELAQARLLELYRQVSPRMEYERFAPKFNSLDPVRKRMLSDMIAPYAIVGSKGNVLGFNCDLDAAYAQVNRMAQNLAKMASKAPESAGEATLASTPELDAKTSSSAPQDTGLKPDTLENAFKLARQERLAKKGRQ